MENTFKQVKDMNKSVQDMKVEIEAIKKTQAEGNLEMENLRKRTGSMYINITNRIQDMKERISA
jgi:predicted  nucleic acid-binding Zn-ribbon protein